MPDIPVSDDPGKAETPAQIPQAKVGTAVAPPAVG